MKRVAVVGAGLAGLAVAFEAVHSGATVTLVDGGAGASSLSSGAVDDVPWAELARAAAAVDAAPSAKPISDAAREFLDGLELFDVPETRRALLASSAGLLRGARGRDRALLDFAELPQGAVVVLPRVDRAGWDADALAIAFEADPAARTRALEFIPVDVDVLRFEHERFLCDADLAALHDDPARLGWLAERLRRARGATAVLLGPWLGADRPRAETLTELVGARVGEVLTASGSPSGLRFDAARARLVAKMEVSLRRSRVKAVSRRADRFELTFHDGSPVMADAVVLAIGGMVSGGVIYDPPEHEVAGDFPLRGGIPFRLSLELDEVRLATRARGEPVGIESSMQGPELDLTAWPTPGRAGLLERIGVAHAPHGVVGEGLFAAGDARADRPRTILEAIESGLEAGALSAS